MTNPYYNPEDLVEYLTKSRQERSIPSFSNDLREVAGSKGKVFGVGVEKTPEGVWKKIETKSEATGEQPETASSIAMQQLEPTGMATVDAVARNTIEKVALEQERDNMLAEVGMQFTDQIERLSGSLTLLDRAAQSTRPDLQAKYGPAAENARASLADAINIRNEALNSVKVSPEFRLIEGKIAEKNSFITSNKQLADLELQAKTAAESFRSRIDMTTAAEKEELISAVGPATTLATSRVLNTPDAASAKSIYALQKDEQDPVAIEVIDEMARNAQQPTLNTPIANIGVSKDKFHWYGQAYVNSMDMADIEGRDSANYLLTAMEAMRENFAGKIKGIDSSPEIAQLKSQLQTVPANVGGKANPQYDILQQQLDNTRKSILAEQLQTKMVEPLKGVLLTSNTDLMVVPKAVPPANLNIATPFVVNVMDDKNATLDDAVDLFYSQEYPVLLESGYKSEDINWTVRVILENYMERINARHSLSGIELTPADLPSAYRKEMSRQLINSRSMFDTNHILFHWMIMKIEKGLCNAPKHDSIMGQPTTM